MNHSSKLSLSSTHSLLTKFLENPELVQQIRTLPAPSLLKLVNKVGLEDSSELLALATTTQLTRMLDEDLWQQKGGSAEEFSPERLAVWLGALEEIGSANAAGKLSEMDEEFLCYVLSHYLNAIDLEALSFMRIKVQGDSWEDDRLESMLESQNSQEIGDVLVLAKATAPWDTLLNLLLALDNEDTSLCGRLLHRLCAVTEAKAEKEGGLFEVLSQEEMLEHDAGFSRDLRRNRDGYVPATDAAAFVEWLKATPSETLRAMTGRDPVSRAYFREYEGARVEETPTRMSPLLLELLGEEEIQQEMPLLLEGQKTSALAALMARLGEGEDRNRVLMELNFLAQVVMLADKGSQGRLRQSEAAREVIRLCELGLERMGSSPAGLNVIQLFGLGSKE